MGNKTKQKKEEKKTNAKSSAKNERGKEGRRKMIKGEKSDSSYERRNIEKN